MDAAVVPRKERIGVDHKLIRTLGVFAGTGFHDTAVRIALETLGYRVQSVGYAEWDSAAAAILLARMEGKSLHSAPVWCDCISRLDARPLRGMVDLIVASPPCQPYSSSGKRAGNDDARSHGDGDGPLHHIVRIFDEIGPAVGWFENVPEWFTDGHFQRFGEQLGRLGYDIAPPFFSSSGRLGNVHERERVFCMVYRDRSRWKTSGAGSCQHDGGELIKGGGTVGDPIRSGPQGREQPGPHGIAGPAAPGPTAQPSRAFVPPLCPPGRPIFDDELAEICGRDQATLGAVRSRIAGTAESLRQWAELAAGGMDPALMPAIEPRLSVVSDADVSAEFPVSDLLRCGGNAVDPLVVADAFGRLWVEHVMGAR